MESERNPSGLTRGRPRGQASPAGVAHSPSRPVPSQPVSSLSSYVSDAREKFRDGTEAAS
jgi:hypothetical protein